MLTSPHLMLSNTSRDDDLLLCENHQLSIRSAIRIDSLPMTSACLSSSLTTSWGLSFEPSVLGVKAKGYLSLLALHLSIQAVRLFCSIWGTSSARDATTSPRTGMLASMILLMFLGWISKWMIPPRPSRAAALAAGPKAKTLNQPRKRNGHPE